MTDRNTTDNRTTELTATDRLRELLDERGVEWWSEDDPEEPAYHFVTKWFANAQEQTYEEIPAIRSKSLKAFCVSPEQAIAATLGGGECHMSFVDEYETASGEEEYLCECSECGYRRWELAHDLPLFCSKCGKAVKR